MIRGIANFDISIGVSELSDVLKSLGISHYAIYRRQRVVVKAGPKLPFYPTIVSTMSALKRVRHGAIFGLIPDSVFSDMGGTSVQVTELDVDINYYMNQWLEPQPLPELRSKTTHEYVCSVSPPSFLDTYQTLVCKINPYDFRKRVMAAMIKYINGKISKRALHSILSERPRSAELIPIITDNKEFDQLCAQVQSGKPSMDFSVRYMRSALTKL